MIFSDAQRPVIILGNGVRMAGALDLVPRVLDMGVPVLTSWPASDIVDNDHPMYFGRPGVYGQRCANHILSRSDVVLAIGCRMCLWLTGYAPLKAKVHMVDVDGDEVCKISSAVWINQDANKFLWSFLNDDRKPKWVPVAQYMWIDQCNAWRAQFPWLESPTHDDPPGAIHAYRFIDALQQHFEPDEVIVTDAGSFMCPAWQVLLLKPPQRLMSSLALGEMGCGLPAAVGASFARSKGRVICLMGDGGMMFNLQELQTIVHHRLPVKIIVFNNAGYRMIAATQDVLGLRRVAVDPTNGVSFPDFRKVAGAFGIPSCEVRTWEDFRREVPAFLSNDGPTLLDYRMHAEQPALPKLQPIPTADGIRSPNIEEMSPQI